MTLPVREFTAASPKGGRNAAPRRGRCSRYGLTASRSAAGAVLPGCRDPAGSYTCRPGLGMPPVLAERGGEHVAARLSERSTLLTDVAVPPMRPISAWRGSLIGFMMTGGRDNRHTCEPT